MRGRRGRDLDLREMRYPVTPASPQEFLFQKNTVSTVCVSPSRPPPARREIYSMYQKAPRPSPRRARCTTAQRLLVLYLPKTAAFIGGATSNAAQIAPHTPSHATATPSTATTLYGAGTTTRPARSTSHSLLGHAHAHGYACKQHSPQNSQPTVATQTQSRMADSSFAAHRRGDAAAPCSSAPSRRPLAAGSHRGADPTPHVLYCGLAPERHAIRSLCLRVSRLRSLTPC